MRRTDSLEKTLMLGKIEGGRRRGWQRMRWLDGITTWWTWVWVNSGSWWWTGRAGMLWFMGSQRVGHDWATDLFWSDLWLETILLLLSCNLHTSFMCGWFSAFTVRLPLLVCLSFHNFSCFYLWPFLPRRNSFIICCHGGLVVLNPLSFCLSIKLLIFPSSLNDCLVA